MNLLKNLSAAIVKKSKKKQKKDKKNHIAYKQVPNTEEEKNDITDGEQTDKQEDDDDDDIDIDQRKQFTIKYGKPVFHLSFKQIKTLVIIFVFLSFVMFTMTFRFLVKSLRIRGHLGTFINMISSGDGEVLPTLLALPVLGLFLINSGIVYLIYKIFSKMKSPRKNWYLFGLLSAAIVMIIIFLIVICVVLSHIYGSNQHIYDGIITTMKKYSINSFYKTQIDRLQIEFQCCGSRKYNDWYNISWNDKELADRIPTEPMNLEQSNPFDINTTTTTSTSSSSSSLLHGQTPFSCCAIKTRSPCIHTNIESNGINYIYDPKVNLSISVTGCFTIIIDKKREVGVGIVFNLLICILFELIFMIPARFLQTAHSINNKFDGNSRTYTVWLIGMVKFNKKPIPPPVPLELME